MQYTVDQAISMIPQKPKIAVAIETSKGFKADLIKRDDAVSWTKRAAIISDPGSMSQHVGYGILLKLSVFGLPCRVYIETKKES